MNNNQFKLNKLYLSGNSVTADANTIYINGFPVSGGTGGSVVVGGDFVDLTSNQIINGNKIFTGKLIATGIYDINDYGNYLTPVVFGWQVSYGLATDTIYRKGVSQPIIDVLNKSLYDNFGVPVIDWNNKRITGNWNFQSLYQSGFSVANTNTVSGVSGALQAQIDNFPSRSWSTLTWGPTTTWSASQSAIEDKKKLVMTGNTTLSITNLYNGWVGLLQTVQSGNAASGYGIAMSNTTKVMNAGSGIIYLTSGSGVYDMISFQYDGVNLFANVGNQFT